MWSEKKTVEKKRKPFRNLNSKDLQVLFISSYKHSRSLMNAVNFFVKNTLVIDNLGFIQIINNIIEIMNT